MTHLITLTSYDPVNGKTSVLKVRVTEDTFNTAYKLALGVKLGLETGFNSERLAHKDHVIITINTISKSNK